MNNEQMFLLLQEPRYEKDGEGEYTGQFFHFDHVTAKNFECLSTQGSASTLAPFLKVEHAVLFSF